MILEQKKTRIFIGLLLFFILIGVVLFLYWLFHSRFYAYTNNAYVNGNKILITSQIAGTVIKIGPDDTCFVEKGSPLVELDPTDRMIILNSQKEKLANTCRSVVELFEQVKEKEADVQAKRVVLNQSLLDFKRRKLLLPSDAVSVEDFQQAASTYMKDYALLQLAQSQLKAANAQIENTTVSTHPKVKEAIASLKDAYIQLKRCRITAPVSGLVAQRTVQVGQQIKVADALMTIIPLSQMWVDANFREVQMGKMRIGQIARIKSDIYGSSVEYQGQIIGIGGGTGSVFSLLPPQNATGNWVKIVQRIPVRIRLNPEQLKEYPLRLGLSMEVTVDLHDQEGKRIPSPFPETFFLYKTDIFENEEEGVEDLIEALLKENIPERYRQG